MPPPKPSSAGAVRVAGGQTEWQGKATLTVDVAAARKQAVTTQSRRPASAAVRARRRSRPAGPRPASAAVGQSQSVPDVGPVSIQALPSWNASTHGIEPVYQPRRKQTDTITSPWRGSKEWKAANRELRRERAAALRQDKTWSLENLRDKAPIQSAPQPWQQEPTLPLTDEIVQIQKRIDQVEQIRDRKRFEGGTKESTEGKIALDNRSYYGHPSEPAEKRQLQTTEGHRNVVDTEAEEAAKRLEGRQSPPSEAPQPPQQLQQQQEEAAAATKLQAAARGRMAREGMSDGGPAAALRKVLKRRAITPGTLFGNMDANKDDTITADELQKGLKMAGIHWTVAQCSELFKSLDRDGDDILSWQEVRIALEHPKSQGRAKKLAQERRARQLRRERAAAAAAETEARQKAAAEAARQARQQQEQEEQEIGAKAAAAARKSQAKDAKREMLAKIEREKAATSAARNQARIENAAASAAKAVASAEAAAAKAVAAAETAADKSVAAANAAAAEAVAAADAQFREKLQQGEQQAAAAAAAQALAEAARQQQQEEEAQLAAAQPAARAAAEAAAAEAAAAAAAAGSDDRRSEEEKKSAAAAIAANELGLLKGAMGQLEEAVHWHQHATEADPSYAPAWENLAKSHARLGQGGQAAEAALTLSTLGAAGGRLHQATAKHKAAAEWHRLGDAALVDGRAAEAKALLQCAHVLHPTMETGRQLEDAHAELVSPLQARTALAAANWSYKAGHWEHAQRQYEAALRLADPRRARCCFGVARCYLRMAEELEAKMRRLAVTGATDHDGGEHNTEAGKEAKFSGKKEKAEKEKVSTKSTVKVTVHRARKLRMADGSKPSGEPFVAVECGVPSIQDEARGLTVWIGGIPDYCIDVRGVVAAERETEDESDKAAMAENYLRNVRAFAGMSTKQLHKLAQGMTLREFETGDKIIQKGQLGTTFYLIKRGTVGFDVNDDGQIVATRSNGEFFGEISLLNTDAHCTATAIASVPCACYTISRNEFNHIKKSAHLTSTEVAGLEAEAAHAAAHSTSDALAKNYLKQVPTFANLSAENLDKVAQGMVLQKFESGATIIKKGQVGTTFYMIKSGTVGFDLNDDGQVQKSRSAGEFFGEISLLNAETRCTATVIASVPCVCYSLSRDMFDKLLKRETLTSTILCSELLAQLSEHGEVVSHTVRQKPSGASWAFVTYHSSEAAAMCVERGTQVPVPPHTGAVIADAIDWENGPKRALKVRLAEVKAPTAAVVKAAHSAEWKLAQEEHAGTTGVEPGVEATKNTMTEGHMHAIYENVHKETRPSSSDKPGKATWEERLQFSGIAASSSLLSCMLYTHHPPPQDDSSDKDKTIVQDKKKGRCRPKKQPAPLPTSSSEADSGGKAAAGRKMPLGRVVVDVAEMSGKPKWFELKPMRGCREPKGQLQLTCEVVLPPLLAEAREDKMKCLMWLEACVEEDPCCAEGWRYLAAVLRMLNKSSEATIALRKADALEEHAPQQTPWPTIDHHHLRLDPHHDISRF